MDNDDKKEVYGQIEEVNGYKNAETNADKNAETNAAATEEKSEKHGVGNEFSARRLALIAVFTALAYGISFLEFPIFPAVSFLKLDFSFAIMLIASYMLGALSGEVIVIVFTLLKLPLSQTGMVGDLANFVMAQFFVVMPSLIYYYRRKFSVVIFSLVVATAIVSALSLVTNRYMLLPMYMGSGAEEFFMRVWYYIVLFNVIKGVSNGIITVLLYKRLKKLLHKFL